MDIIITWWHIAGGVIAYTLIGWLTMFTLLFARQLQPKDHVGMFFSLTLWPIAWMVVVVVMCYVGCEYLFLFLCTKTQQLVHYVEGKIQRG